MINWINIEDQYPETPTQHRLVFVSDFILVKTDDDEIPYKVTRFFRTYLSTQNGLKEYSSYFENMESEIVLKWAKIN